MGELDSFTEAELTAHLRERHEAMRQGESFVVGPGDLVNELADRAALWASNPSYGYTRDQLEAFRHRVWSRLHDALYHTEVPSRKEQV